MHSCCISSLCASELAFTTAISSDILVDISEKMGSVPESTVGVPWQLFTVCLPFPVLASCSWFVSQVLAAGWFDMLWAVVTGWY
ncbi:hypothetical protein EDD16DRAFT_1580550 [Pisolithus croceorrhizus]|nr:hypothetical protein EDD16DRAFT_1580550 [Pisolithus croceorrhizus]